MGTIEAGPAQRTALAFLLPPRLKPSHINGSMSHHWRNPINERPENLGPIGEAVGRDRLAKARKIRAQMGIYGKGGQAFEEFYDISSVHTQGIFEWCFGMVWSQPLLDLKTREIAVISAMAAQDLHDEVEWHARSALNLGLTREEIIEVIGQCSPYTGLPKTNHALKAAMRALKAADQ